MLVTLSEIHCDKPLHKLLLKTCPFFKGISSQVSCHYLHPPKTQNIFQLVQTGRSGPLPILPSPFHVFERRTIGGKGGKVA